MGANYLSVRAAWPTFANGEPADAEEDFAVVDARIDALTRDDWAEIVESAKTESLASYGDSYVNSDAVPDEMDAAQWQRLAEAAGIRQLRVELKQALRELNDNEREVVFDTDGCRWWAESGGVSWGGDPTDAYDLLKLLAVSGVANDPIDGGEFVDVPAQAAAVAVLDSLADVAVNALRAAGVTGEPLEAAAEALRRERANVAPAARLLRQALHEASS